MEHPLAQDLNHVLSTSGAIWESLRNATVFITGGTAFVGTWLVESFVWANEKLGLNARLVLLTRNPDAFRAKAPWSASHPSVHYLCADGYTFEFPKGEFPFVIHAAIEKSIAPTPSQPAGTFDGDVEMTRRVLEFARTHGARRFLFTSSGAVYGKQPPELTHIPEEYAGAPSTMDKNSAYGQAKRISEFLCARYADQFGFAAVIGRMFAFAGPHLPLDINFAIGNFVRDVLAGGPVRVGGDGTPHRSYLYAADLAAWLWTLLIQGESARPYNVGSGRDVTIAQLANLVVENTVLGIPVEIARKPETGTIVSRYVPSVARVRDELGMVATISLEEAIRRMYEWNLRFPKGRS